jgi:hypothetical protein
MSGPSRLTQKQRMKAPNKYAEAPLRAPAQTETLTTNSYHSGCGRQDCLPQVHEEQPSFARPLSAPIPAQKTRVTEKRAVKKGYSYEPLATAFTLGGFDYRQIAREGDWAIYEQRWRDSKNGCYEVIRIRREEAATLPSGRSYPAREVYPPSEAWARTDSPSRTGTRPLRN